MTFKILLDITFACNTIVTRVFLQHLCHGIGCDLMICLRLWLKLKNVNCLLNIYLMFQFSGKTDIENKLDTHVLRVFYSFGYGRLYGTWLSPL